MQPRHTRPQREWGQSSGKLITCNRCHRHQGSLEVAGRECLSSSILEPISLSVSISGELILGGGGCGASLERTAHSSATSSPPVFSSAWSARTLVRGAFGNLFQLETGYTGTERVE